MAGAAKWVAAQVWASNLSRTSVHGGSTKLELSFSNFLPSIHTTPENPFLHHLDAPQHIYTSPLNAIKFYTQTNVRYLSIAYHSVFAITSFLTCPFVVHLFAPFKKTISIGVGGVCLSCQLCFYFPCVYKRAFP
jgi:hypothetical protein